MHSASPPIAGCTPVAISKGRVRKNNASENISYKANKGILEAKNMQNLFLAFTLLVIFISR
jgi:hypothetical protein